MDKLTWMKTIKNHDDYEYLMHTIGYHAAPTLKGVKVSSLINFTGRNYKAWKKYNHKIKRRLDVEFLVLKEEDKCAVVLFYHEAKLKKIVSENQDFLRQFDYESDCLLMSLNHLSSRFEKACPHEIGIFLGYPAHDVKCFLECNKACLRVGYWKVYHNEPEAVKMFKMFDQAKEDYHQYLSYGYLPSEIITQKLAF